jgi:hypothetical protein
MNEVELERVREIRHHVLHLHKQLLDAERIGYERVHGRTAPADFLRVVIEDDAFAWLRPMTAAIVRIDEWLDEDPSERGDDVATAWLDEIARLLAPEPALHDFHAHYAALLQADPQVVVAHGAVARALTARGS